MRAENDTPARAPLDAAALRRSAVRPDGLWREIEVVESTGSTNADLLARALPASRRAPCWPPRSSARAAAGWAAPGPRRRAPR